MSESNAKSSTGRNGGKGGHHYKGRFSQKKGGPVAIQPKRVGACDKLGSHVFDYGTADASDLLTTTYDAVKTHVGTHYNEDIKMELETGAQITIPVPKIPQEAVKAHEQQWEFELRRLRRSLQTKEMAEDIAKRKLIQATERTLMLERAEEKSDDLAALEYEAQCNLELTLIQNEIDEIERKIANPPKPTLEGDAKFQYEGDWKTYTNRKKDLERYRGMTYNLIYGQCTQVLMDKLKDDPTYKQVTKNCNPLKLKALIDKIVMAQTKDQYYCKTIYDQERKLSGFTQGSLTNAEYYRRFNNQISVDKSVGITRVHKTAMIAVARKLYHKTVEELTDDEQAKVEEVAEESYLAYVMLMQSTADHQQLKTMLEGRHALGEDKYPKTRHEALNVLGKFTQDPKPQHAVSEGASFATTSGKKGKKMEPRDEYWADKTCFKCGELGHPARRCPNSKTDGYNHKKKQKGQGNPRDDGSDDESKSSKKSAKSSRSKSSSRSNASSKERMEKATAKAFTQLVDQLQGIKEEFADELDLSVYSDCSH